MNTLKHFRHSIARALLGGDYKLTQEGVIFTKLGARAQGFYHHSVNGRSESVEIDKNLLPDAAILSILDVYFGSGTKIAAWYLALYGGAVNPAAAWTAANFAANATEIVSGTEGYSQATRPQWTPAAPSAGSIHNLAAKAVYTIVTASTLTVNGAALLSNNTKGGTGGILASAARFANARTLFNGDSFELGYTVSLTG